MKYLVLPLLLLLSSCAIQNLPPAGPSDDAMKKADVIIIETPDSQGQSFSKMTQVLRKQGYSFKVTDNEHFKVSTNYKTYGKSQIGLSSSIVKTDSSSFIHLTGMLKEQAYSYRVEYGGSAKPPTVTEIKNKSGFNPAWDIMEAIAEKYPDGTILYGRELDRKAS